MRPVAGTGPTGSQPGAMSRGGASLLEREAELIQALQTGDEFFGEGFAGLSP
jgi:hypothetical protein